MKLRVVGRVFLSLGLLASACSSESSEPSAQQSADAVEQIVAQVASYDLAVGEQRFMVGLLTKDQELIGHGSVRMRFGYLGEKGEGKASMGEPVEAQFLPIPISSQGPVPTKDKPEVLKGSGISGVYSTIAGFDRPGFWGVQVVADLEGAKPGAAQATFQVRDKHQVPAIGEDAPRSQNLTVTSVGAPNKAVDSRATDAGEVPDPQLHQTTVAQAIEQKRPVLVTVSTPVYCVSRFCGPITDMVAGLATKYADRAAFAHIEVWRDFEKKEINRAAAEWIYRGEDVTEPWVFLVGADGKVLQRWDNVATAREIEPLLQQLAQQQ